MMIPISGELAATIAGVQPRYLVLVFLSAAGYAVATSGMKLASTSIRAVALGIIVLGFVAATLGGAGLVIAGIAVIST